MPADMSTAALIDHHGSYTHSDAILYLLYYMIPPYPWIGLLLRWIFPLIVRDFGYNLFARNRGRIWKLFKRMTGMGDVQMEMYRDRILGLEEPLDAGWGFAPPPTITTQSSKEG